MTIGNKLKKLRNEYKKTQKQLGEELKISTSVIGDIEIDRRPPSKKTAQKLAKFFNTSMEYWIDEKETEEYINNRRILNASEQSIKMLFESGEIVDGIPTKKALELMEKSLLIDCQFEAMRRKK